MSKFTEMFKAKATQIAITSVSACLVIGVSAGAIVHNNNKKLEAALNELTNTSTTESVTESSSEATTEPLTESTTASTTKAPTKASTTEPAGDRTIQYLAEYEKITREYKKKRAELEEHTLLATTRKISDYLSEDEKSSIHQENSSAYAHNEKVKDSLKKIEELDEQYEKDIENLKKKYGIID